jgi:hypothetical protein
MKRRLAVGCAICLFAILALAHGNEQHVMGTITIISGDAITIQTIAKKNTIVYVNAKTKFTKAGAAATRDDLKVGDRVVVHASKEGDKLVAHTLALGVSKPAAQRGPAHSRA